MVLWVGFVLHDESVLGVRLVLRFKFLSLVGLVLRGGLILGGSFVLKVLWVLLVVVGEFTSCD